VIWCIGGLKEEVSDGPRQSVLPYLADRIMSQKGRPRLAVGKPADLHKAKFATTGVLEYDLAVI